MASFENRLLVPDENILSGIFPYVIGLKPSICDILANTFETCTFRIQLDSAPLPNYSKDLIIRLERSGRSLAALATFQCLASSQLKGLVPSVLQVGTTMTAAAESEQLDYYVTPYFTETILLEDVWDALDKGNQLQLVDAVVLALEQLQKLDLKKFCHSPEGTPYISIEDASPPPGDASPQPVKIVIGGLAHGFFPNVRQFLGGLLQPERKKPRDWNLLETDGGIIIQSAHGDIGQIDLSHSDLDELQRRIVFCHNDLEPRNILVRELSSGKYELAGVIDWERAGFFPFAYESSYKDTVLGSSNLSFSWYTLFKDQSSHLLPQGECHVKLIKALRIIDNSIKRSRKRNVGTQVQLKWLQREQVEESSDLHRGWVRKAGANLPKGFSKDDQNELEVQVMNELGYVQEIGSTGQVFWSKPTTVPLSS